MAENDQEETLGEKYARWHAENLERMLKFENRQNDFERKLDENSATTRRVEANTAEVVDILQSWKGAAKVMNFLAAIAKPFAAIVTFGLAVWAGWPKK